MKIIVRADDLGLSEAVNYAILKTVQEGVVNNVGLMVNMEAADHGVQILSKTDASIGLHVNISVGKPVSDAEKIPSLVNGEAFKKSSVYRKADKDFVILEEAIAEVEKQVELFQKKCNKKPDYMDFHAVFSPNFMEAVRRVAAKYEIPFIGMPLDGTPVEVDGHPVNLHVSSGENETFLFKQFQKIVAKNDEEILDLVVFHPGYIDRDLVEKSSLIEQRIYDTSFLVSTELKQYIADEGLVLLKLNALNE